MDVLPLSREEIQRNLMILPDIVHVGLGFRSIRSGYNDRDEDGAIGRQEREILNIVSKFWNPFPGIRNFY